jgi:hypothetical protein
MTSEIRPPDLEMRVRTVAENGRTRLTYTLHSPTGVAPFSHREIAGPVFQGSPEDFQSDLLKKIEQLGERLDVDGEKIFRGEIERKLAGLGRQLWRELFPPEFQHVYRGIRRSVRTWIIVSDEPWIPWEMVKPYDDGRPEDLIDDDFLSLEYELTRWLAGDRIPSPEFTVRRLATIRTDVKLPQSPGEQDWLAELARRPGVEDASRFPKSPGDLLAFLEGGGGDIIHFIGHGTFTPGRADESAIPLPDGRLFRPTDLEGPVAARIRRDRPLVFLNACWSGQQGWSLTHAGGWATRWVGGCGSGAFVMPLWPVRDQTAHDFAQAFYEALWNGATLGRAALQARQHLRATREVGDISTLGYTVYGHPNARVLFGEDASAQVEPDFAQAPPSIREKILSFDLLIQRKTEGFVGRQWLFDAINGFVQSRPRGYVQILGDPGVGKTTLIAEMVRRHRYPHHFNIRSEGIQKPEQFLQSLCAQLVAKFGLGYSTLPPEVSRDSAFLLNLLERAAAKLQPSGRKLLILVDALDESDLTAVTRGANTLYLPTDLPDGVFIVVTSQRGGPPLRYVCEEHKIYLQTETANNFADVRLFAQTWLGRDGIRAYIRNQGLDDTAFVDEVVRLSEGNFMYLHYILPEIEKGTYRDRKLEELPAGLQSYYEAHWQRMRVGDRAAWEGYKIPVLVALTIAKEPISMDLIADFSGVQKRSQICAALDELIPFLQSIEAEENGVKETRWRLYHDSFHDFIAAKDQVRDESVDLRVAHGKAADALWRKLYPEG